MDKKVFIIEDDANILYGLQAKFSLAGFKVETSNGSSTTQELITDLKKSKANFIILDLILPTMDGFEVIKLIKSDSEISSLPVFVFTNLSDSDTKSRIETLGIKFYFLKTDLDLDSFVAKVVKITDNVEKSKK